MESKLRRKASTVPIVITSDCDEDISDHQIMKKKKKDSCDENFILDKTQEAKINTSKSTSTPCTRSDGGSKQNLDDEGKTNCQRKAPKLFKKAKTSSSTNSVGKNTWKVYELLAEIENIDETSSHNIVTLFEDDNTIPFICRYRRDMIPCDLQPEKLRDIKNTYSRLLTLKKKAKSIVKTLEKEGALTNDMKEELLAARTLDELEFLFAPYKPANKGSLADRAKALGLAKYADDILHGKSSQMNLNNVVDKNNPDLDTYEKVVDGICHIISHNISKNTEVLGEIRRLQKSHRIILKCSKGKAIKSKHKNDLNANELKYENYFNYENCVKYVKPHQVLAINRGETSKIISAKIVIPELLKDEIRYFVRRLYLFQGFMYSIRTEIFDKCFEECYAKKLQLLISRQIRTDLTETAMKASIHVFAKNLKQLLLMAPVKGEPILGIDPGFLNGCKLAIISKHAEVLETTVIYPHNKLNRRMEFGKKMAEIMRRHGCNLIALGNGTACRETEIWITELFECGILNKSNVRYSIVPEHGASIYSCGDVAKKEFPNMNVNLISAVSIARRLNDPLSEYVKVEPNHIGIGMYQHDVNEKALAESLTEVVTECVSYVGVDINTASLNLLRYIAGLTYSRAEKVIEYRSKYGPFKTRKDLLLVKSIGSKTFTQCAGFVRIEPLSVDGKMENLLDCTWVHPESYNIAEKIIIRCGQTLKNIGQPQFINDINNFRMSTSLDDLEKLLKVPKERILTVFEALQRVLLLDYRSDVDRKPLFKKGITKMTELGKGMAVTGAVSNITHFGAFVDIGVDRDALLHVSQINGCTLAIGDRVRAIISNVDVQKNWIQIKLDKVLN